MKLTPFFLVAAFAAWVAKVSGAGEANAIQPFNSNKTEPTTPTAPLNNNGTGSVYNYNTEETDHDFINMMRQKLIEKVENGAPMFAINIELNMSKELDEKKVMQNVVTFLNRKHKAKVEKSKGKSKRKIRGLSDLESDNIEMSISDILGGNQPFVANATRSSKGISISLPELSQKDADLIMQLANEQQDGTTIVKSFYPISIDDTMDLTKTESGRVLSAASANKIYKGDPNLDYLDGVTGGTFWLHEIGIRGEEMMYGQLDTGIHQKHVDTADMQINRYECTTQVTCTYSKTSANQPLTERNVGLDEKGHGSHVYGDAARVAPGLLEVDDFRVLGTNERGRYEMIEAGIDACFDRLKQLQVQADRAGVKPKKYILNASIGFVDFGEIPGIFTKEQAIQNTATIKRIVKKIGDMHDKYPWFQMVAAAGNNGNTNREMPANINTVIAVASHNAKFEKAASSNSDPRVVAVSAIGVNVRSTGYVGTTSTTLQSGTSMSSPLVGASLGLLWELFPNLVNNQLKQLIQDISVDPSEYNWSDILPIRNKIFSIDINKCIKLAESAGKNEKHMYYIEPELLKKMKAKASSYALDNIPVGQPVFTLPNSKPVPFNANGVATFKIDLKSKTSGALTVAFSSKRVALWDSYWETVVGSQDISAGSIFTKPFDIPISKDTEKIYITITRGSSLGSIFGRSKASFLVKDQNGKTLIAISDADMAGYGSVSDLKIAISKTPSIVIQSCVGTAGTVEATPAPVILSSPRPTTLPTNINTYTPTIANTYMSLMLLENVPSLVKIVPISDKIEILFGNKKLLIKDQLFTLFEKNKKGKFEITKDLELFEFAPALNAAKAITFRLSRVDGKLVLDIATGAGKKGAKYLTLCKVPLYGAQEISFAQVDSSKSRILENQNKIKKGL